MAGTAANKDTIYIDVDDEITTIIDKVRASNGRIVALVLPKRATVLQSVVNMKLLKRSADEASKQVVLITAEKGLLPLAGAVGLYTAGTLQSKPEIPAVPNSNASSDDDDEVMLDDEEGEYTADTAGDQSVGVLADKAGAGLVISSGVDVEDTPKAEAAAAKSATKAKKNKKLLVPNFNKFRVLTAVGIAAIVLLVIGLFLVTTVLPKAVIAISTNAQDVNSSLNVTLDTKATKVDLGTSTVPATSVEQQKTYTKQVDATGKQNNGETADGTVKMTASKCSGSPFDVPSSVSAGTGISTSGKTYITQETTSFTIIGATDEGGGCYNYPASDNTSIRAQKAGKAYNESNASFSVNGRSDVSATGSASGGTDDIVVVVSQSDIDNATGQIDTNDSTVKDALYQQLTDDNLFAIRATFSAGKPNVSSSSKPGDEASTVTVTETVTYTMFGTKQDNLVQLIEDDISQQVDTSKQGIIDDGLDQAAFTLDEAKKDSAKVNMESTATVGPKIDTDSIRQQVAGKKSGEAQDIINQLPGVTDVNIKLSPFWLTSIPSNPDKITVNVGKASPANGS